jgi:ATP-binding cassette subfamily B protein
LKINEIVSGFSKETLDELKNYNIETSDIIIAANCDLSKKGKFQEKWMIATKKELLLVGEFYYPIEAIDSLKYDQLVSAGVIYAVMAGETKTVFADPENPTDDEKKARDEEKKGWQQKLLCRYTLASSKSWAKFVELFGMIKENKEIKEEDYDEDKDNKFCPKCNSIYEDIDRKICPKCFDKRSVFIRVLSFLPKYKAYITIIIVCILFNAILTTIQPYIAGVVLYNLVLERGEVESWWFTRVGLLVLVLLGLRLLTLGTSIIMGRVNSTLTAKVVYDMKVRIFSAMQRLSMNFFANKQTGQLMSRVHRDATQLQFFFHDGVPYFIVNVVMMIFVITVMFVMNWQLAILSLIPFPLVIIVMWKIFPALYRMWDRMFRKGASMNSTVHDSLNGARVIKAFGKEKAENERFEKRSTEVFEVNKSFHYFANNAWGLIGFIMSSSWLMVWGFGGWMAINGSVNFGELIAFTGYIGLLMGPLEWMSHIANWWSRCMTSASRMFEIMDAVPQVMEARDAVSMPEIRGDITLTDVSFEYEANKKVLHNVNLEVKAGEMIGLVGHSGAGKSTLTSIITRLYDIKDGNITIDGVDLKKIKLDDLHKQIGTVMQETYLFMGTMAENIAYAKPDATIEEIIRVSKIARAHEFIIKLPDGYDTLLGSRGHGLSGGEKQRVAIARAILMNPRILVLDEATASLDTETEKFIQEALEELVQSRTTFAIAHRLSTLRNADRLVVVEKGKIEEIGTHEELYAKKGIYHKLISKQREALKLRGVDDVESDEEVKDEIKEAQQA